MCKKTSAEAKAAELAGMRAFKSELDAQIADNKARRAVASMTETERKINAGLLREVDAAAAAAAAAGGAVGFAIPAIRRSP